MTAMNPLRGVLNDTPANAIDVDWNFQTIEDYIATDVIKRDGSVAMEAPLNLLGPAPSLPTHAITKGYVDTQIIPIGTIWQFAGTVAPPGWEFCKGDEYSSTAPEWVPLFNVIQFTYGQNGSNFLLPDLQGRVPVGRNIKTADALFGTLGQKGGSRDITGVAAHTHDMKSHWHSLSAHTHDLSNHAHANTVAVTREDNLGSHLHGLDPGLAIFGQVGSGAMLGMSGGAAAARSAHIIPVAEGNHVHNVQVGITNVGPNNNTSGAPSNNATTGPSDNTTTGPSVAGTTDTNVQPFVVINFIIRVR